MGGEDGVGWGEVVQRASTVAERATPKILWLRQTKSRIKSSNTKRKRHGKTTNNSTTRLQCKDKSNTFGK